MNELKRENETHFDYVKRLTSNRKELDLDYSQWAKLVSGYECSNENGRKSYYLVKRLLDVLDEEREELILNNETTDVRDLIEELEQKKIELFKEKVKLQDQRRSYLSLVRTEARWEALLDLVKESMERLEPLPLHQPATTEKTDAEGTLLLSDWHIGSLINTPHNQFNIEVAKERISKLKDDAIKQCKRHGINRLNVAIMGDMCSGIIHVTTRLNNQEDIVNQTIICSELLAQLINDLSNEIPNVVVHYTIGNHGRVSANVKESLDSENFEYLILEFLKLRLAGKDNVVFNDCKHIDKEIVIYNVFGQTIACVHGHREKKLFNSVSTLSEFLGVKIDMVVLGHFHNFAVKNNVVVNGCLSGADEYANNLRFNNKPSQTLIIHFEDGGKCLYEIIF